MIVPDDVGLNYYGNERDESLKRFVISFSFTIFCIHGNHEKRPFDIQSYKTIKFHGGTHDCPMKYEPTEEFFLISTREMSINQRKNSLI